MNSSLKPLARLEGVFSPNHCDGCGAIVVFDFKAPEGNHPVDMKTVLHCLKELERQSIVTPLPDDWWLSIYSIYQTSFSEVFQPLEQAKR